MNEPTIDQRIARGNAAERILKDEAFQDAVKRAKAMYEMAMHTERVSHIRDLNYHRWNALNDVLLDLEGIMNDGKALSAGQKEADRSRRINRAMALI